MSAHLRGSSWDHPRGHAPMLATAAEYAEASDGAVSISWVPRSLKAFGTASVDELAADFDLILVDHPHIGTMAEAGCVVALDELLSPAELEELASASPGRSHQSYEYAGHQWALAVDTACQVSARRPDLLGTGPESWAEVVELARSGRVLWPLCDVDSAASFFSLTAQAGRPCAEGDETLVDREAGLAALEIMRAVAEHSDPQCLRMNPIAVLEAMSSSDDYAYSPLVFGYVNYSRADRAGPRLSFGNMPVADNGPVGSLLGGVGLAVSSRCRALEEAVAYARYVASPAVQRGLYFSSGGQPAHAWAWADPGVDAQAGGFFSSTRPTIDGAWTRPRWPRFAMFQNEMIELFATWAERVAQPDAFLDELDRIYRDVGLKGGRV